jgi:hypothetical protein
MHPGHERQQRLERLAVGRVGQFWLVWDKHGQNISDMNAEILGSYVAQWCFCDTSVQGLRSGYDSALPPPALTHRTVKLAIFL